MIKTETWHLVNHTDGLAHIRDGIRERRLADVNVGHASGAFTEQDKVNVTTLLDLMSPWLECLSLNASLDRVNRIRDLFEEGHDEFSLSDLVVSHLETLCQVLQDELKRHVFMYLPPTEVKMYENPCGRFPKTVVAFPAASQDIEDASRCYAVGQSTACVFHCMGVLQHGLYSLARDLQVPFSIPIELQNWQNIIEPIERAIKSLESMPKGKDKDERLTFYSRAAVQFRYFKDAWRNHICHMRQVYDANQALSILNHVADFMETISTRLKE